MDIRGLCHECKPGPPLIRFSKDAWGILKNKYKQYFIILY
jgi:hypothetical protein